MKATGLFFLRAGASIICDPTGARLGVCLPVIERDPDNHRVVLNEVIVEWRGSTAVAFFDKHHDKLRAGCPLQIEVDRLRGQDREWRARAIACELAPVAPSWRTHAERTATADPDSQPHAA